MEVQGRGQGTADGGATTLGLRPVVLISAVDAQCVVVDTHPPSDATKMAGAAGAHARSSDHM